MKKLIKEYVNTLPDVVEEAKEIKVEYNNEDIRIGVSSINGNQFTEYYYYNPIKNKITEGAGITSNSSNYSHRNIGDIELIVLTNNENNTSISINRIIQPYHEDMSYADEYEERKFELNNNITNKLQKEQEFRNINFANIVECIDCGRQYLSIPDDNYNIKLVENGKVCFLDEEETKLVCSECTDNQTISKFLNIIKNESEQKRYESYLINYIGLEKDELLFLD